MWACIVFLAPETFRRRNHYTLLETFVVLAHLQNRSNQIKRKGACSQEGYGRRSLESPDGED
jgi:hypothetical protein